MVLAIEACSATSARETGARRAPVTRSAAGGGFLAAELPCEAGDLEATTGAPASNEESLRLVWLKEPNPASVIATAAISKPSPAASQRFRRSLAPRAYAAPRRRP